MYVRSTYATGNPAEIHSAIEALRTKGAKILAEQPGYRGIGIFADRALGKILLGSWWESREAEFSIDEVLEEPRAALLWPFARTVARDVFEVAVTTSAPVVIPGGGFRMARIEFNPADAEHVIQQFREAAVPRLHAIAGFAGTGLLVDRTAGRGIVGTLWADRPALELSRGAQALVRGEVAPMARMVVRSLEEFEVVLLERLA